MDEFWAVASERKERKHHENDLIMTDEEGVTKVRIVEVSFESKILQLDAHLYCCTTLPVEDRKQYLD